MSKSTQSTQSTRNQAMLIHLTINTWGGRIVDNAATRDVIKRNDATKGAGKFNKALLPKQALKELKAVYTKARQFHKHHTLTWSDSGTRILPTKNYAHYIDEMDKHIEEAVTLRAKLVKAYPDYIDESRILLGKLFNAADYPDAGALAQLFNMTYTIMPMPETKHILFDMGKAENEYLARKIQLDVNDKLRASNRDLYQRIDGALSRIVERLTNTEEGEVKVFCKSMIDQTADLVSIIPSLNIAQDDVLADLCRDVKKQIASVNPDHVRPNSKDYLPSARAALKENAMRLQRIASKGGASQ